MRFKKIRGTHYRMEDGKEVAYNPGSIIEVENEDELRIHDAHMNSWERVDAEVLARPSEEHVIARDGEEQKKEDKKEEPKRPALKRQTIKKVPSKKGKGKDIVNTKSGKTLNEQPLSDTEADSLVKEATEPIK